MNIREIVGLAPVMAVHIVRHPATAVPLARALAAVEAVRKAVPTAVVGVGALTRPADFAAANLMFPVFALTQVLGVGMVALISQAVGRKDQAGATLI